WDWSSCKPEVGRRHHTKIVRKVQCRSPCREIAEPARPVGGTSGARPFTWPGTGEPAEELAAPAGPGLLRAAGISNPAQEGLSWDIPDSGARSCPVAGESSPRGAGGGVAFTVRSARRSETPNAIWLAMLRSPFTSSCACQRRRVGPLRVTDLGLVSSVDQTEARYAPSPTVQNPS